MWKDIPDTNGYYSCNEFGEIKSNFRVIYRKNGICQTIKERILKAKINNHGYAYVSLRINKHTYDMLVHRLVALTWLPNPESKETINHKDGNPLNNKLENLEWATQSENNLHRFRVLCYSGVGSKSVEQYDEFGNLLNVFPSCSDASMFLSGTNNKRGNISKAAKFNLKRYGYYWKFVE